MSDLLASPTGNINIGNLHHYRPLAPPAPTRNNNSALLMQRISQKYGEEKMADGKLMSEELNPENATLEAEMSDDEHYTNMNCLKGERVDPQMRIFQVNKILLHAESLTAVQRRSLVSRRNTAKLRLRQRLECDYATLIHVDLNVIQEEVSFLLFAFPFSIQCLLTTTEFDS